MTATFDRAADFTFGLTPAALPDSTRKAAALMFLDTLGITIGATPMEAGRIAPDASMPGTIPRLPKTIDFTVDYLRSGLPRDAYARAQVNRSGRRYASVHVEAWQDNRARAFAQATGHFLMPSPRG